jgi:hypothetical protein
MTKTLISIFIFLFSISAQAEKPVIARNDLTFATGTGIEDIQFLFGGDEEQITGIVDKEAIRKQIHTHMLGVYRCYAAHLRDSKKTGKIVVDIELKAAKSALNASSRKPKEVRVLSSNFDSKDFSNCVAEHWSKIPMPTSTEGTTSEVIMPILARLRATDSLHPN